MDLFCVLELKEGKQLICRFVDEKVKETQENTQHKHSDSDDTPPHTHTLHTVTDRLSDLVNC